MLSRTLLDTLLLILALFPRVYFLTNDEIFLLKNGLLKIFNVLLIIFVAVPTKFKRTVACVTRLLCKRTA